MSKKLDHTPRKSPRLVEATSTTEIEAPTFNILTQSHPPNKNESPAKKGGTSQRKKQVTQKGKKSQEKKIESPANQKGQKKESDSNSNFVSEKKKKKKKKTKKSTNVDTWGVFKTIKKKSNNEGGLENFNTQKR
uniref:Uncharacterized protein n=1 Tax=Solanum tuberosum TaxID=4113 RepID=M1DZN4_SOLTU